ncbi:unnamed protein product [Brassica oleracea]
MLKVNLIFPLFQKITHLYMCVCVVSANSGVEQAIGCYDTPVQELIVIDDLLSALVGIEGRYISIKRFHGKEDSLAFQVDPSMDLALQATKSIFPLCECFLLIDQFVESSSQFKKGLVNHAFAAALRALLLDYQTMVAQLEHQFRLGRLSLQGLWFYCQPMMGSMCALAVVIQQASAKHFVGSGVLNLLQSQEAMAGDNSVRSLLEKMTECASNAYLSILERWVYEGIIDDPYGEFFIAENRSLKKESLIQDSTAKYWSQRYSLKETIPGFLANIAATILTTGKYLNVMRECGHNVQVPISERSKLTIFGSNHHYLECIKAAHEYASKGLVSLIMDKGDFLVHFMDIAREELNKKVHEISVEKLQSLLDLALRTTAAAADPRHEDLTCCVDRTSLLTTLGMQKDLNSNSIEDPVSITGLETFSLGYKVQWPLSIVISKKALSKYQLIFRFLFHCKHVERQLCGAWQIHQGIRSMNSNGTAIRRSSLLCRSMLKFISSLLHYLTFEASSEFFSHFCVLEPNWHVMHDRLQSTRSVDEVIQHHDFFLDKCLRGCLLLLPDVLKKMEKLKSVCLQYAEWLISSSIHINSQSQKTMIRDTTVTESIFNFEREFNSELQSLGPVLSKGSQAEPYLTHLSHQHYSTLPLKNLLQATAESAAAAEQSNNGFLHYTQSQQQGKVSHKIISNVISNSSKSSINLFHLRTIKSDVKNIRPISVNSSQAIMFFLTKDILYHVFLFGSVKTNVEMMRVCKSLPEHRRLTYFFIKEENHKHTVFLEVQGIPEAEEAIGYALTTTTKTERFEDKGFRILLAYPHRDLAATPFPCKQWDWAALFSDEQETTTATTTSLIGGSPWFCEVCFVAAPSLEDFTTHLKSVKHAYGEWDRHASKNNVDRTNPANLPFGRSNELDLLLNQDMLRRQMLTSGRGRRRRRGPLGPLRPQHTFNLTHSKAS